MNTPRLKPSLKYLLNYLLIGLLASQLAAAGVSADEVKQPRRQKKAASADPVIPEPTLAEVRYGDHERQVLDFWKAESATATPVAFVIHGGGWMGGDKERVSRFVDVKTLLAEGHLGGGDQLSPDPARQ